MLTKKPLAALLLLSGAAGGPYMLYETDAGQQAKRIASQLLGLAASASGRGNSLEQIGGQWLTSAGGKPLDDLGMAQWNSASGSPHLERSAGPGQLTGPGQLAGFQSTASRSLADVLRFDVTPQWITQQYGRVSTILADLNLDGMRVPLVTGTQVHDLAGTLTYYFDRFERLQRISIHGVTGDPNRLVHELRSLYKLEEQPSLGGGLYFIQWNGKPTSLLHVAPASVIQAGENYARYTVFLELNLPTMPYGLSQEAAKFVQTGKASLRW